MTDRIDTADLLSRVDIVQVIDGYVPLTKSGAEYEACCPFHTEATPSFKVSPSKQFYNCFGCGANGDAIKFLQEYAGMSFIDACRELGADVPAKDGTPAPARKPAPRAPIREKKESPWKPIMPAPADAPEPPKAHVKRGLPERVWCYRAGDGAVLGYVYRFKTSDGGKEVLPLTWCRNDETGEVEWHWMAFPEPRPLYGLDALSARPEATVLLVEGEKCKDVGAEQLGDLVVVTWPGGGKAVKKVDWSPLFGRKVIQWADCDAKRVPLSPQEVEAIIDDGRLAGMPAGKDRTALVKELTEKRKQALADAQALKPLLPEADQPGVKTMAQIAAILLERGSKVWSTKIPAPGEKPDGWDIADAVAEGLVDDALAEFLRGNVTPLAAANEGGEMPSEGTSTPSGAGAAEDSKGGRKRAGWEKGLIWKERGGGPEDCRENVFLILSRHPSWAGVIGYNEFAQRIEKRKVTPTGSPAGEWSDQDDYELGLWFAQKCDLLIKSAGTISAGVSMVAHRNRFHPVREWLEALPAWDGTERLDHWLTDCIGIPDSQYVRLVGRFFLLGMVARIYKPGCAMQYMPIFEGPQGKGKSTMLRILGGDWYAETPFKIGDKDAYQQLQGTWLYEIPEMDSFNKAESTAVKAFVTIQVDRYREPYARRPVDRPRQCVFAGNTNHSEYFKDTTGNRRFWPVRCSATIDLDKLAEWRVQLFAEAMQRFHEGARWHPTREEELQYFKPQQEEREIVDPWLYPLQDWLDDPGRRTQREFTSQEVLTGAFNVAIDKIDGNRGMATRLGNLMARLGWSKGRRTTGKREWIYLRPAPAKEVPNTMGEADEPVPF